jgi:hypothetical protein
MAAMLKDEEAASTGSWRYQSIVAQRTIPKVVVHKPARATIKFFRSVAVEDQSASCTSTVTMAKQTRVHVDLDDVQRRLDERLAEYDRQCAEGDYEGEDGPACEPVVVFHDISHEDFAAWLDENDGMLRRWEYEPFAETEGRGRVVIYSFASDVHEETASWLVQRIYDQILLMGNDISLTRSLKAAASPTCRVGDRNQEPDMSLKPRGLPRGAFPTLIVEVSYKNLSWNLAVEKLERWMGPDTTVQVAIGIHIFPTSSRRRCILMRRNPEFHRVGGERLIIQEDDFHTGQQYRIAFPVSALYVGVNLPGALIGHANAEIVINLPELLEEINATI